MFRERLISGIILVAIALAVIIAGGPVLFAALIIISLIGMRELYKALSVEENGRIGALSVAGYIGVCVYYAVLLTGKDTLYLPALMIGLCLVMAVYVFTFPRYKSQQAIAAFFGSAYVGVMLSFIYLTRMLPDGAYTVWLIFICSWGSDTCAYCVGRLIGRHKMAPVLSPKKSIEGAVGGVAGAAAIGAIYAAAVGPFMSTGQSVVIEYAVIGVIGALISMIGDLAASAIKRNNGIKDYGHLIPGHGGILDRFDSVIFTAPFIYLLAQLILQ